MIGRGRDEKGLEKGKTAFGKMKKAERWGQGQNRGRKRPIERSKGRGRGDYDCEEKG